MILMIITKTTQKSTHRTVLQTGFPVANPALIICIIKPSAKMQRTKLMLSFYQFPFLIINRQCIIKNLCDRSFVFVININLILSFPIQNQIAIITVNNEVSSVNIHFSDYVVSP